MKVLWFSVTPSLYSNKRNAANGGGWIESLERIVSRAHDCTLAISFLDNTATEFKVQSDAVTYYPLIIKRGLIKHYIDLYSSKYIDQLTIKKCVNVIEDFKPDIIHIFGSEWCFGLLKEYTDIPIVIHMQGSWPPYRNAIMPPSFSSNDDILRYFFNPRKLLSLYLNRHGSLYRSKREEKILSINKYYMGRTRWDRAITRLYNPESEYYFCNEALRNAFIDESRSWCYQDANTHTIVTVGACNTLKGYDVILKTAKLLRQHCKDDIHWILCGADKKGIKIFEKKSGIKSESVGVTLLGKCSAEKIKDTLLASVLYVHTSYIDNSPNSICEAQYLGLPIISTNVGGIPSLFDTEYPNDMLVPTNDPYYLASKIIELINNEGKLQEMSNLNKSVSKKRHNDDAIYRSLLDCYIKILTNSK